MQAESRYLGAVGRLTLLSAVLALACLVVGAVAVEFDFDAFGDPTRTLAYARNHVLMFWFNILDLFGYYLLLIPLVLQQHQRFHRESAWMPLITLGGVAYAVVGACGAAVLAVAWPHLMHEALGASAEAQQAITLVFTTVTVAVTKGLWNILEMVFAATWWIGSGLLQRTVAPALGWLSVATGLACVLDLLGNLTGLGVLSAVGLNLYLVLAIVWAGAIGTLLLREARRVSAKASITRTTATPPASRSPASAG
jgi:hypothetical protein